MYRKDRVLEALRSLCEQRPAQSSVLRRHAGFSAEDVAEVAQVDRSNASRDLNLLAQEGNIERLPGRPVLFRLPAQPDKLASRNEEQRAPASVQPEKFIPKQEKPATIAASIEMGTVITSFETLIGYDEGLKVAIQQAKAAIIYPPRGLHTLLRGPSGVGKTTFARLMHAFALSLKALPTDAPFISFNCADYAGNPQLLMAHLFGVVRGAYTGADHDRQGLVEQAHRGILFLDEVHRLPPEGQEMLFYLMDRERFRRLGDVKERQASLLLLAATTEDPETTLLPTFRRRIPMTINLPGLHERTMMERYELIRAFFTTECSIIGTNIQAAPQVLRALLLYDCPGNIGQLRTDVQLTCARAYLEYRTNNLAELNVHVDILPDHIRSGLLRTADMHRNLEPVLPHLEATHIFTPTGLSLNSIPESAQDLYETINTELTTLRNSGLREDEINELLHLDIQYYFLRFAKSISKERSESVSHLIDDQLLTVSRSMIEFAEQQLERGFPEKLALVLALHLASTLERIEHAHQLVEPALQGMRQTYPLEYEVAQMALVRVRSALDIALPESEADVLAVLFAKADTLLSTRQASVGIVIAAHGRGIAAGLTELAASLVGTHAILAVELTIEQSPEELLTHVEHSIYSADQGSGVLLLVDFASLLSLAELVTRRTGVQVRAVAGVSAPLVIEAVRKAQRAEHVTLEQLEASLVMFRAVDAARKKTAPDSKERAYIEQVTSRDHGFEAQGLPAHTTRVILSVCLTGFGSATKLADLIEEHLPEFHQQGGEMICMDIGISGKTEDEVRRLVGNREVVAIIGTINPHLESYPFISLTELLFGNGIARIRTLLGSTLIDPALLQPSTALAIATPILTQRADLLREIEHTLNKRMFFLNPTRILPLIERMIELIEVEVGETFDLDVLAGLVLHLACILERAPQPQRDLLVSEKVHRQVEQQYPRELSICRRAWQLLGTQITRSLPDDEAYNIVGILRQIDIFSLSNL